MQTLEQANDWVTWMEQFEREDTLNTLPPSPAHLHDPHGNLWGETDRQLHFRALPSRPDGVEYGSSAQPTDNPSPRARWLREHDVQTEFLDAGIGCCWFAYQGDDEPVCGETEGAAIARLASKNGLPWVEPSLLPDASNQPKVC